MKRISTAVLALSLLSGAALAQDTAAVFLALDSDQNGSISQTEAQRNTSVVANFTTADSNGDGALSRDEFDLAFG